MSMKPQLFTLHALSVETGLAYRVVAKRLRDVKPESKEGKVAYYRLNDVGPYLFKPRDPDVLDIDEARARRATAEAKLAEYDLAEKMGEMVRANDIEAALDRTLSAVGAKLDGMAAKLAPLVAHQDVKHCRDAIDRHTAELKADLQSFHDDARDDAGSSAAA